MTHSGYIPTFQERNSARQRVRVYVHVCVCVFVCVTHTALRESERGACRHVYHGHCNNTAISLQQHCSNTATNCITHFLQTCMSRTRCTSLRQSDRTRGASDSERGGRETQREIARDGRKGGGGVGKASALRNTKYLFMKHDRTHPSVL